MRPLPRLDDLEREQSNPILIYSHVFTFPLGATHNLNTMTFTLEQVHASWQAPSDTLKPNRQARSAPCCPTVLIIGS
jgi:hypothetical protein